MLTLSGLELENINVFYGEIQALWDVSLSVKSGSIASVIGSNGSGKTTLLKTIMGLTSPRSGTILFDGERIDGLLPHRIVEAGIVYVPEGRHIFPDFTVKENLKMGSFPVHARKFHDEEIERVYEIFPDLRKKTRQRAGTLSGGEAQMLAIDRALMSRPKLLMLDEPSAGLAPMIVSRIFEAISLISHSDITVIMVEQDVVRVLSMSSMACVLENGRITRSGPGEDLLQHEDVRKAYLGL
ncbi:MAG: ABC transporter ATP-binding protein [Thaumarchaeota archaeon]|nr:ABC transporter ATP-binding protein [Nitrososphaerota archaeon]